MESSLRNKPKNPLTSSERMRRARYRESIIVSSAEVSYLNNEIKTPSRTVLPTKVSHSETCFNRNQNVIKFRLIFLSFQF